MKLIFTLQKCAPNLRGLSETNNRLIRRDDSHKHIGFRSLPDELVQQIMARRNNNL